MTSAIVPAALSTDLLHRAAEAAAAPPVADETARAHEGDWRRFAEWCATYGLEALPAAEPTIATYLMALSDQGKRYATIARAYASLRAVHARAGQPLPTLAAVRNVLRTIAREHGTAQTAKAPLTADRLRVVAGAAPEGALDVRDRALLLLGFAAALRRSEIVALDVGDLAFTEDGVAVTVRRSKTDQAGEGRTIGVPHGAKATCPVRALRRWLECAGSPTSGPLFRAVTRGGNVTDRRLHAQAVARIVKGAVAELGLDPDQYAGHSLRAGLATSAAKAGKSLDAIMCTTGHRSERMVRRYIRHASVFDACASEGLL